LLDKVFNNKNRYYNNIKSISVYLNLKRESWHVTRTFNSWNYSDKLLSYSKNSKTFTVWKKVWQSYIATRRSSTTVLRM